MLKKFFFALTVSSLAVLEMDACTGLKLTAKDGTTVHGRTLEFGVTVDTSVAFIPRDYAFTGTTSKGEGKSYTSKYATLGAICYNNLAIMDGINEEGLAVGTFYFPGFAGYTPTTAENQKNSLSQFDFPNWILTQFRSLDEVKQGLQDVVIAPFVIAEWGSEPAPFHYIVYEKSGASLVIEPINGKLVVRDNPLGVLTNSPEFDWHITNLRNFINLNTKNPSPVTFAGLTFAPFGQGAGMVGLPGDFTPPSRFVRAAIFSQTATPVATTEEAVFQTFHLLNQFDIPVGLAKDVADGVTHTDYTILTGVRDPNNLKYYFKTYTDQNINVVDMKQFDKNAKAPLIASMKGQPAYVDFTGQLKPYSSK